MTGCDHKCKCKLLIIPQSCSKYPDRRDNCRNSWLRHVPEGVAYFFAAGSGEKDGDDKISEEEPDMVLLGCEDTYWALPRKTYHMMRYALEHYDFEYVFKCDDDTYVCIDRLLKDLEGEKFVSGWGSVNISGGAGYWLCREYVELLVKGMGEEFPKHWAEDICVKQVLEERYKKEIKINGDLHASWWHPWPDKYVTTITQHYMNKDVAESIEHMLYGPVTDVLMFNTQSQKRWHGYFFKNKEGVLRFVSNSEPLWGTFRVIDGSTLELHYEKKDKIFRFFRMPGDYWEEEDFGPLSIISPLNPEAVN